jgi:hypothetical protein
VKSHRKGLRSVWLVAFVLACLPCASAAWADDTVGSTDGVSVIDDGTGDLPPSELTGWFFPPSDPNQPFPPEPDPSQPWTSAANLATIDYWLSVVVELGNDPSLLQQLYGWGMISSPDLTSTQISQLIVTNQQLISQESSTSGVPEPMTMGLLGGGLAFLGLFAAGRARRIRRRR